LLFLCAGKIIHGAGGGQDIRRLGGLIKLLPVSGLCLNIANLALCGFPFLAGFYSKDLILEWAVIRNINWVILCLLILATIFTCIYSFRLSWYVMGLGCEIGVVCRIDDWEKGYTTPIMVLLMGAIFRGGIFSWLLFDSQALIVLSLGERVLPAGLLILGFSVSFMGAKVLLREGSFGVILVGKFLGLIWFMPYFSSQIIINFPLRYGEGLIKIGDAGWGEFVGGQGLNYLALRLGAVAQVGQGNSIRVFILIGLFWIIRLVIFNVYSGSSFEHYYEEIKAE